MRQLLENRAAKHPDKTFLLSEADGRSWTYLEFNKAVNRAANLLLENGIKKGDVVSLLLPNSAEYVIAYFACFKIGAIAGPVNSLLKSEEIEYVIKDSEAKLLLAGSQFFAQLSEAPVPRAISPYLQNIIRFDDEAEATKNFSEELEQIKIEAGD